MMMTVIRVIMNHVYILFQLQSKSAQNEHIHIYFLPRFPTDPLYSPDHSGLVSALRK